MEDFTKQSDSGYNRALREPRRTAADSSWDVCSNYLFCPRLCEECRWFSRSNSNWPFHCKGPTSRAASHESKKDGYKQYDHCISFEKIELPISKFEKDKQNLGLKDEKQNNDSHEVKREPQFIGYCFSCDEEIYDNDQVSRKHNEIFHQECYRSYINTDEGRAWDSKAKENERLAEDERQQKIKEHNEWLKTPEGIEFIEKKEKEQRQKELESKEKENKERIESEIKKITIDFIIFHKNRKGFLLSLLFIPLLSYVLSSIICYVIPFAAMGDILFGGEYAQIKIAIIISLALYFIRLPKYKLPKKTNEITQIKKEIQTIDKSKFNYIKELYDKINEYSNEFKDYVYILDENKEKLQKAKNAYANYTDNEIPLIMYNDTVTGSAKDGFILTNYNLYAHSTSDKKIKIPINEITSLTLQQSNLIVNKYSITLILLNKLNRKYLFYLLNELLNEEK